MGNLHDLVEQACNYGLVGGERYSCLKAVQVPDLRKALECAKNERNELIRAIIRITEASVDHDRNRYRWEEFQIALSKADELVDSIPHNIPRTQ